MTNDSSSSRTAGSRPIESLRWFVSMNRRKLVILCVVALAGLGLLVGGVWGLHNYIRSIDRYMVSLDTLAPEQLPDWVTPEIRKELLLLPGVPREFSLLDSGICRTVARAYRANPWVAEVLSVEKRFPHRLHIELRLRKPLVAVKVGQSYYLTDVQGVLLSPPIKTWPFRNFDLPVVLTGGVVTVPARGQPWHDFGVLSGVAVQTYLRAAGLKTRFTVLDLRNIRGRVNRCESEIVLRTVSGSSTAWGRSPLETQSPGELSPFDKIAKMQDFESRHGALGLYRAVRIQYDDRIYFEPASPPRNLRASGG